MDQLRSLLLNPNKSIRHVHCCTIGSSGSHLAIKREILKLNEENNSKECLIVATTCKYANTLPLMLQDLGDGANISKDKCKTIDEFINELITVKDHLAKKRIILAVFNSEDLPLIGSTALTAFLSIPSSYSCTRILTVSEAPWGFTEQTEAFSLQPLEIFYKESISDEAFIADVAKKAALEENIVRLVIQAISIHVEDRAVVLKICKRVSEFCKIIPDTLAERDKINAIRKKIPEFLNEEEGRYLLKHTSQQNQQPARLQQKKSLNLPILDQLLVISAYCATHNSVASDKRYFVKHHGKEKRNETRERAVELAVDQKENGPKAADIQRIQFIFEVFLQQYKDVIEKRFKMPIVPSLHDPLPRFATLINASYFSRGSSFGNLDQPKIKCMISIDFAKKIARNLDINLEDYLERQV